MDSIKGMFSSPIDAGTNEEIKNLIKTVLTTFTKNYVKYYAIGLVKKAIDDAAAPPDPDWKLLERPPGETKFMEGWVLKRAGPFTKSMQKRYFVVRNDYMIDYYLTEEEAKKEKGKKKGTISLCGYWVNEDANAGMIQRLMKLAEKMGLDTSAVPKPTEFPAHTMELYHSRRKSYYIQLEDKELFNAWVGQMRTCCWLVRGFKNKDPVHVFAFNKAIWKTRWHLGRWGWWGGAGTEEQMLSDLISDELDWDIMGRIYCKLNGPWQVRSALQKQVLKVIDKMVIAAVSPAWAGMAKTVEEIRPKIEPKIVETVGPIGKLQLEIITKIKDACMSVITPAMNEHVIPHLAKILTVIQSPMTDAFNMSYQLFGTEVMDKFQPKDDVEGNKKEFKTMDHFPWSYKMWEVTRRTDEMYDPLWALNIIFSDIHPWSLIWHAHDHLKKKMDNAIFTFETRLLEAQEKGEGNIAGLTDATRSQVTIDYKADGELCRVIYFREILKKILMPPLNKILGPLTDPLISPVQDAIPEPMQDFIDINDMFNQVVEGVVDDTIDNALRSIKG